MAPSGPPGQRARPSRSPNVECCFLFVGPAKIDAPLSPARGFPPRRCRRSWRAWRSPPVFRQEASSWAARSTCSSSPTTAWWRARRCVRRARAIGSTLEARGRAATPPFATRWPRSRPRARHARPPRPAPTSSPPPPPPRGPLAAAPGRAPSPRSPRLPAHPRPPSLLDVKSPVARFAPLAGEQRPVREQGDDVRGHRHPRREHPGRELQHLRREPRRLPHEQRHVNRATRDFRSPRRRAPFGEVSGWRDDEGSAWGRWANGFHGRLG